MTTYPISVINPPSRWCDRNRHRVYIPEWLLAEWGMHVEMNTLVMTWKICPACGARFESGKESAHR